MTGKDQVVHLKHCKIVSPDAIVHFSFGQRRYSLTFERDGYDTGKFVIVDEIPSGFIDVNVLLWLSVYFGEDFVEPYPHEDTRHTSNRGDFQLNAEHFVKFMRLAERTPARSWPKWKKQLLQNAISYYSVAVRSSIEYMPLTIGFFGLSLECIGNLLQSRQVTYYTLGDKRVNRLIKTRLRRRLRSATLEADTKALKKRISADLDLVHLLRNAYYGHSFLHQRDDRNRLADALCEYCVDRGFTQKIARRIFSDARLDESMQIHAAQLYKVGLRLNRIIFFMLLGFSRSIPIASHDFSFFGKSMVGETVKFRDMCIKFVSNEAHEASRATTSGETEAHSVDS